MMDTLQADVVVVAAHPDDAELCCGGTIVKLVKEGRSVVVADCTRGELGTRGTPETRREEAEKAGAVMNIAGRVNLGMKDGSIEVNEENILKLIQVFRRYRPALVLMPGPRDRHIDHEDVHRLVRKAVFQSGLPKVETAWEGKPQQVWRPSRMLCYLQSYEFPIDFYVDITDEFEAKIEAVRAYSTQFYVPDSGVEAPETFISRPEFMEFIEARARYFGEKIGVRYAEAFATIEPLGLSSLSVLPEMRQRTKTQE